MKNTKMHIIPTTEWHLNRNTASNLKDFRLKVVNHLLVKKMPKNENKGGLKLLVNKTKFFNFILINKKGIFTWTKMIIGLLLLSLFVVVLGGVYVNMANNYNVPVSDKYSKYESRIQSITNKTTSIGEQYQGAKLSETNTLILAGSAVWAGIQIMLNSITIPISILADLYTELPFIPKIFISVITAIITIGFIYLVGSALARWQT